MSALVRNRNVPDEVRRTLKARAAARGVSLNTYLADLLADDAARPTVAEVLDRARARTERSKVSSLEYLHAEREERANR